VTDRGGTGTGPWSLAGIAALWAMTFLMWRTLALMAMWRPGWLATVPTAALWITWAILAPLASVGVLAGLAHSLGFPAPTRTLRIVFATTFATGLATTLLLRIGLEGHHPFPDLGGYLVASVATTVYFLAAEIGREG
jgi:hypothetical protein